MPYKWMSKEETEMVTNAIKEQVKIHEYASSIGFTVQRKGKYYTLKEHDSVRIDPGKNCFWQNSVPGQGVAYGKGGSVIDFSMMMENISFHDAFLKLQDYINVDQVLDYPSFTVPKKEAPKIEKQSLRLPEKAPNMRRVYAYLLKSRCLEPDVVQDFVSRKMLYQDVRGNCCFVGYDDAGKPNYGFLRGTNTQSRFIGDVPGCDYANGFYIHNNAQKLIVAESVIDAASVMSILHAQGFDFKEYDYYALTGTCKLEGIFSRIEKNSYTDILLAPDNDASGKLSADSIKDFIEQNHIDVNFSEHIPVSKDWNQDLVNVRAKFGDINSIHFFPSEEPEIDLSPQISISSFEKKESYTVAVGKKDGIPFEAPIFTQGDSRLFVKFPDKTRYYLNVKESYNLKKFAEQYNAMQMQKMQAQYDLVRKPQFEL